MAGREAGAGGLKKELEVWRWCWRPQWLGGVGPGTWQSFSSLLRLWGYPEDCGDIKQRERRSKLVLSEESSPYSEAGEFLALPIGWSSFGWLFGHPALHSKLVALSMVLWT